MLWYDNNSSVQYLKKRQIKTWFKVQSVLIKQQLNFKRHNMCKEVLIKAQVMNYLLLVAPPTLPEGAPARLSEGEPSFIDV